MEGKESESSRRMTVTFAPQIKASHVILWSSLIRGKKGTGGLWWAGSKHGSKHGLNEKKSQTWCNTERSGAPSKHCGTAYTVPGRDLSKTKQWPFLWGWVRLQSVCLTASGSRTYSLSGIADLNLSTSCQIVYIQPLPPSYFLLSALSGLSLTAQFLSGVSFASHEPLYNLQVTAWFDAVPLAHYFSALAFSTPSVSPALNLALLSITSFWLELLSI